VERVTMEEDGMDTDAMVKVNVVDCGYWLNAYARVPVAGDTITYKLTQGLEQVGKVVSVHLFAEPHENGAMANVHMQ
jgi:hypothetical protein